MRTLAEEELTSLDTRRDALLQELKLLLVPKDPNDEKNVLLEIRAGTGGDEAALFAAELYRCPPATPNAERVAPPALDVDERHRNRRNQQGCGVD